MTRLSETRRLAAALFAAAALILPGLAAAADEAPNYEAVLTGASEYSDRAEIVRIGSIPVRLATIFVAEENAAAAREAVQAILPPRSAVECRLRGARDYEAEMMLVGDCFAAAPAGGEPVDIGAALLASGHARPCVFPDAMITIYPNPFICN